MHIYDNNHNYTMNTYLHFNNSTLVISFCIVILAYIIISKYMNTVIPEFKDNVAFHLIIISIIVILAKINIQIGLLVSVLYILLIFKKYNMNTNMNIENFSVISSESDIKKNKCRMMEEQIENKCFSENPDKECVALSEDFEKNNCDFAKFSEEERNIKTEESDITSSSYNDFVKAEFKEMEESETFLFKKPKPYDKEKYNFREHPKKLNDTVDDHDEDDDDTNYDNDDDDDNDDNDDNDDDNGDDDDNVEKKSKKIDKRNKGSNSDKGAKRDKSAKSDKGAKDVDKDDKDEDDDEDFILESFMNRNNTYNFRNNIVNGFDRVHNFRNTNRW